MTVTVLWQVPFCLLLYYRWGILPALIVNMVMNIAGVVMAPGPFWILNPWAAPSRLMTGVIGVLPNGLLAIPGSVTYTPGIEAAGQSFREWLSRLCGLSCAGLYQGSGM